jgi:hypothetical protein
MRPCIANPNTAEIFFMSIFVIPGPGNAPQKPCVVSEFQVASEVNMSVNAGL